MIFSRKIRFYLTGICLCMALLVACASPEEKKAAHFTKGMEYLDSANANAAILEFRNAIQIDPKYAEARYQLGLAYLKKGEIKNAFQQLERASSLDPTNHDALLKTAEILFLSKNTKESRAKVDQILAAKSDSPDALALLAQLELAEKNTTAAEKAIDQALRLKPEDDRYYSIKARVFYSANRPQEAEKALRKALELKPDKIMNHRALIAYYSSQHNDAAAEKTLKEMIAAFPEQPEPHLDLANFYMTKGNMAAAEESIKAAIDKKPDSSELLVFLGNFYRKSGKIQEAEKAYLAAADKSKKNEDAKAILADFYLETNRPDLAKQKIAEIFTSEPQQPLATLVKAKLLLREKKNSEALTVLDALVKDAPRWGEALYLKALAHYNLGEARLSQDAVDLSLKYAPGNSEAHTLLAQHLLLKRDYKMSLKEAAIALRFKGNNFRAAIIFGKSLLALGEADKALQLLNSMEAQVKDNPEIIHLKSLAYLAKKDLGKARAALEQVLTLKPHFTPALATLTAISLHQNHKEQAIARVREQIKKAPDNPDFLILLARLVSADKKGGDEALALLRQAQELAPDAPQTYLMIAQILAGSKKLDAAIDEYQSLLKKSPDFAQGHLALGTLLEQTGDLASAKKSYRQALALQPKFAAAANNLAWLLCQDEKPDLGEALRLAMVAKERLPDNPYIADTLGWIHFQRGSYKLALTQLSMATEKLPDVPTIRYHLAKTLQKDGQSRQAAEEITKCLQSKEEFKDRKAAEQLRKELQQEAASKG